MKKNMKKMSRITAFEHSSLKKVLAKDAEGAKKEIPKHKCPAAKFFFSPICKKIIPALV
jgi:hypothetical protein